MTPVQLPDNPRAYAENRKLIWRTCLFELINEGLPYWYIAELRTITPINFRR